MDLAIRGGTICTGTERLVGDVGVLNGRIAHVGGQVHADREIDARGRLVLPGGVDPHVHLVSSMPAGAAAAQADDIRSGTRAAAVGGITTVGNISFPEPGEDPLATVERTLAIAAEGALVDVFVHPVVTDPSPAVIASLPALAAAGHPSLKVFMVSPAFDARIDDYLALFAAAARAGITTMVHCEDGPLVRHHVREVLARGGGGPGDYPRARPPSAEAIAVARIAAISRATGAHVHLAHVASGEAVAIATAARDRGAPITVETRPIYLLFAADRFLGDDGALYVGNPPLRTPGDVEEIWAGLVDGRVDVLGSDHAPWMRSQKLEPGRDVSSFRPGMPDLETMLPLLFSEGVRTGRLSIERFIEVTAGNAARAFGLDPAKGGIRVGGDADLVVWDPDRTRVFHAAEGQSRTDWSLYDGRAITGWPVHTLSRGRVVVEDGEVVEAGAPGRPVPRTPKPAPPAG